jgi:hypothetical protein
MASGHTEEDSFRTVKEALLRIVCETHCRLVSCRQYENFAESLLELKRSNLFTFISIYLVSFSAWL